MSKVIRSDLHNTVPGASAPSLSSSLRVALIAVAAATALAACGGKDGAAQGGGVPGGGMPPAQVGVVTVKLQPVALQTELPGRVEAVRVAQVRARVSGVVLKRLFVEGSLVKAGQPLFQIDPAPYRAAYDSAEATLAKAQANLAQATTQADRFKPLVAANAISKQDMDNANAAQKQAEADVAAAKAAVQTARINLDYASVTAPISGRIGRALVTEGALVTQAEGTQLATIQQTDTMYVNFTQSTSEVLRLRKALAAGRVSNAERGAVRVVLDDGTELKQSGKLLFSDVTVDQSSGQITLRAEVANPDGLLLPGQYVRVRLSQAELPQGVLLPQQAVTRSNQGDSVMVVGADGKVAPRPVKVSTAEGNQWVVLDGLKPGEQVMVDGFQKLRPNATVQPVPWQAASASAAAAGASGGAGRQGQPQAQRQAQN
ncbi:MAG TPA: efflux RND transporter periplasmic adaptor subunit [Methylibium sp.]